MDKKLVKSITSRDVDFAQWYTDLCLKAELMDYTKAKGFIIYRPYGYAIWENIQKFLDEKIKKTGHENVYMPLVMTESLFLKEVEHVEGFAPECAMITSAGNNKLTERLVVRPTSEVLFCDHYSKIISSYRDLPKLYNQWCSVVRWEKTTRPFLRGKEFLWQEGHTAHATEEEARKEVKDMLDEYRAIGTELLAIPFITGKKTEKEKFAGAIETYSIEALMHDGKALQSGTTHYFGTEFAKAFDIKFQDKDGKVKYVYQTSWGVSTRFIGAIIMVHGDDDGLVLPPFVAPIQAVIIPIMQKKPGVLEMVNKAYEDLKKIGIRVKLDDTDKSPGWKYAEYEMKGVPIRIEMGPRDIEAGNAIIVFRYNREKRTIKINDLEKQIPIILKEIHDVMYDKALKNVTDNTRSVTNYDEFKKIINEKSGYVKMMWCGDRACEEKVKADTTATSRCLPFDQTHFSDTCPVCNKKAKHVVYFAKAY